MQPKAPPPSDHVEKRFRIALEQIVALRGYQGEDMGRVSGYRVAAEIAEEALRFHPALQDLSESGK